MNKCSGCGAILQNNNLGDIGYTTNINNSLCLRCFRIKNYNDYQTVIKDNADYIDILKEINKTSNLVILVVDIFDIPKNLADIRKYIHNDILLVLTKRDILPIKTYDLNLTNYFKQYNLNQIDTNIISSKKNYNYDLLYENINRYKNSNKVYVVGFTNAGKSSMINKLIYNYGDNKEINITTSSMPSTTIDTIEININEDLKLIDTPGLLVSNSYINYVETDVLKHIVPSREINPIIYQIKAPQTIFVENFVRIDFNELNNAIFYFSNSIEIDRVFKNTNKMLEYKKWVLSVPSNSDIIITGLGFIKITNKSKIILYTHENVDVYVRPNLI